MTQLSDKQNRLANTYLSTITKFLETHPSDFLGKDIVSQDDIWELSKKLAIMATGPKSFAKMYNSKEGREERNNLLK